MRRWVRLVLVAVPLLLTVGAVVLNLRMDNGPYAGQFQPITVAYHECGKCGSLDGGLYGKGPTEHFRTDPGRWCVHDWRPIGRGEFKRLATERFGRDWSGEPSFWSDANDDDRPARAAEPAGP